MSVPRNWVDDLYDFVIVESNKTLFLENIRERINDTFAKDSDDRTIAKGKISIEDTNSTGRDRYIQCWVEPEHPTNGSYYPLLHIHMGDGEKYESYTGDYAGIQFKNGTTQDFDWKMIFLETVRFKNITIFKKELENAG